MGRPLPAMLDAALEGLGVRATLEDLVRRRFNPPVRLQDVRVSLVKRRVVRYQLALEGHAAGTWCVIGKVYDSPEVGQHAYRLLSRLAEAGFSEAGSDGVRVPRALGFLPEASLLLMEGVGGRSLKQVIRKGEATAHEGRRFAEALLGLHSFPGRIGEPFTLADHLRVRCANLVEPLTRHFPELADDVAFVLATAEEMALRREQFVLCHGDYHPGQVHTVDEEVWVLDLDALHQGDPAYDVALVLSFLARCPDHEVRSFTDGFLATYFVRADPARGSRLPVNQALVHLKRACKRFRWQDEDAWELAVRREIRRAAECSRFQSEVSARDQSLEGVFDVSDGLRRIVQGSRSTRTDARIG